VFQKNGYEDILKKVSFSIPIFHCYGHNVPCQVIYLVISFHSENEKVIKAAEVIKPLD